MRTLVFLLAWFSSMATWGFDLDLTRLPADRILSVTGHPDYAPIVWRSQKTGELKGVSVEMLTEALKGTGIQIKFVPIQTWGRAQKEVEDGHIDVLLPPYKNEERLKYYSYQESPLLMDRSVLFVRKGHKFPFHKLSDLKSKHGVAIISDSFGDEFDRFDKKTLKMVRLPTTEQCFLYVLKGRADFMVAGSAAGKAVAAKLKVRSKIEILDKEVIVTGMYAGVSKKSAWDRPEFHRFLMQQFEKMRVQKLIPKLEDKYIFEFSRE